MRRLIMILVISLAACQGAQAQGWAGALQGLGDVGRQLGDQWQREAAQESLERARADRQREQNEFIAEQERLRAERERQLMQDRRAQELASQREQQQIAEKLQKERAAIAAERAQMELTRAKLAVEQAHPGWENTIKTEQFRTWRNEQLPSVQRLGDSDDSRDAILMLDLYKKDIAPAAPVKVIAKRDSKARAEFLRQQPCPATGQTRGACPGYVVDHVTALACGGADNPRNMQWMTTADAKAKDRIERKGC